MCEINPKHKKFFKLEVFTSNPNQTEDEFNREVAERVLFVEQWLNSDGRYRFHIHEFED